MLLWWLEMHRTILKSKLQKYCFYSVIGFIPLTVVESCRIFLFSYYWEFIFLSLWPILAFHTPLKKGEGEVWLDGLIRTNIKKNKKVEKIAAGGHILSIFHAKCCFQTCLGFFFYFYFFFYGMLYFCQSDIRHKRWGQLVVPWWQSGTEYQIKCNGYHWFVSWEL